MKGFTQSASFIAHLEQSLPGTEHLTLNLIPELPPRWLRLAGVGQVKGGPTSMKRPGTLPSMGRGGGGAETDLRQRRVQAQFERRGSGPWRSSGRTLKGKGHPRSVSGFLPGDADLPSSPGRGVFQVWALPPSPRAGCTCLPHRGHPDSPRGEFCLLA